MGSSSNKYQKGFVWRRVALIFSKHFRYFKVFNGRSFLSGYFRTLCICISPFNAQQFSCTSDKTWLLQAVVFIWLSQHYHKVWNQLSILFQTHQKKFSRHFACKQNSVQIKSVYLVSHSPAAHSIKVLKCTDICPELHRKYAWAALFFKCIKISSRSCKLWSAVGDDYYRLEQERQ